MKKNPTEHLVINIPKSLKKKFKTACTQCYTDMSNMTRTLIAVFLISHEASPTESLKRLTQNGEKD
jgi:hypothetical protein